MENGATPDEMIPYLLANDSCNSQKFDPAFRQYRIAGFTGASTDDIQGATYTV
jgi:hypothetical protein